MFERARRHRMLSTLAGAILAGLVAGTLATAGLPSPYPVVVAIALFAPVSAIVGTSSTLDVERYAESRGRTGIAVDVLLTVVAGTVAGALLVTIAVALDWSETVVTGVAIGATFIGGYLVFYWRTRAFQTAHR